MNINLICTTIFGNWCSEKTVRSAIIRFVLLFSLIVFFILIGLSIYHITIGNTIRSLLLLFSGVLYAAAFCFGRKGLIVVPVNIAVVTGGLIIQGLTIAFAYFGRYGGLTTTSLFLLIPFYLTLTGLTATRMYQLASVIIYSTAIIVCSIYVFSFSVFASGTYVFEIILWSSLFIFGILAVYLYKTMAQLSTLYDKSRSQKTELLKVNQAMEASASALSFADINGYVTWANNAYLTMFGYNSLEETIGKHVSEAFHSETEYTHLFNTLLQNKNYIGELELRRKDRSSFFAYTSAHVVESDDGTPLMLAGSFIETTLRKKQEERLYLLQSAIDQSPVSIVITNKDADIQYINPFFTKLTGYTPEEVIGDNPRILQTDYHTRDFYQEMWDTLTAGFIWSGEFRNTKKNGEYYWEQAYIAPVLDKEGNITHYVGIKEDITEQKQMQQKLKNAHDQFITVLGELDAGVVVIEVENGTIKYANRYLRRLFGGDITGKQAQNLFSDEDNCEHPLCDAVKKLISEETADHISREFKIPGLTIWVYAQIRLINWIDNQTAALCIMTDITPLKDREQLKEDIDRITRHDLKTPLNGVLGLSGLLKKEDNLTEEQQQWAEIIEDAGKRMLTMINQSLDLYKMEKHTYKPELVSINLIEINERVIQDLSNKIERKKLKIVRNHPQPDYQRNNIQVHGEYLLCYSIISNLLTNAIEASGKNDKIEITVEPTGKAAVSIRIHNPKPIPEDIKESFGRKYTTYGKTQGTGLGVYSARLMIETLGGEFGWDSSEENGTTVFIYLPKASN